MTRRLDVHRAMDRLLPFGSPEGKEDADVDAT